MSNSEVLRVFCPESIKISIENELITAFTIDKNKYKIIIYGDESECLIVKDSGSLILLIEDECKNREFTNIFPDVDIFVKLCESYAYDCVTALSTCDTYMEYIHHLKRIESTNDNRDILTFEMQSDIKIIFDTQVPIAVILNTEDNKTYRIGKMEMINSFDADPTNFDVSDFEHYDMMKEILKFHYNMFIMVANNWNGENKRGMPMMTSHTYKKSILTLYNDLVYCNILDQITNTSDNSELICIENPATQTCKENDGIPRCLFVIRKLRWESIVAAAKLLPNADINHDYSSGGHGCIISYNIIDLINGCRIFNNLSADVIDFIKLVADDTFISSIVDDIKNGLNTSL